MKPPHLLSITNTAPTSLSSSSLVSQGDTSSGKSSLLSSIAMVELPSASELTTRCPIELKMRKAEVRQAVVTVKWREDAHTKPEFQAMKVDTDNWNKLSSAISKAQDHVMGQAKGNVSRDMVIVAVEGPMYIDLTLVDLPGIVRSVAKDESSTLCEEIDALINDYLKNKRCVILAVVPANVDFHNSQVS